MPVFGKATGPKRGRGYPYGVGDGTRDPQPRSGPQDAAADDNNQPNEGEAEDAGQDANNAGMLDAPPDVGREPYDGVDATEQIINVSPDQAIKLVITSTDTKKDAKKEHPQERIAKFWSNFEPEYVGGITQILPDPVGETPVTTTKKLPDTSPKATYSYEAARASCIKSVKRIIRESRANNQKYTDAHFDIERDLKVTGNRDCLYGLTNCDEDKNPGDVKRVTDIFEHPQFFKDGAGYDDIVQGALGDCWFLASLSAITANQELLRRVCVIQDQDVGVYGFVFHRDGEWHPCIIDDKLYLAAPSFDESGETVLEQYGVKQKEQEKLYIDTLQKGSKALFFASCRDENETWVPLLEKAYAKFHGDFTALDGGQVGEALEDLTGGVTTEIYTTNILSKENFWKDLCRIGKDFIFSCHVSVFSDWRGTDDAWENYVRGKRLKGIIATHAYSVLATYEGYGQRLVKIRNPWGETEWSGAWSDGSKEWTADWLYRLEHKFGDDGVFWMSYDDMLRRYKYMDRTRLMGPEWYIEQQWTSVQVPWNCRDYQSTTFSIEVAEDTDAVIVLSQLDDRFFCGFEGPYWYTLSFRVQKFGDDEDDDDYFARSPINYELRRSTNVEVHLEKGKYTVLFKIEANKCSRKDIETVIRENSWRRDKITQIATLYDLAFRKGRPPKSEKKEEEAKEEPKEEAKPADQTINLTQTENKKVDDNKQDQASQTDNKGEDNKAEKKEDAKPEEKAEDSKQDTPDQKSEQKAEDEKDDKGGEQVEETKKDEKAEEKKSDAQEQAQQQSQSSEPPAVMSTACVTTTQLPQPKSSPDDTDPNRNPWNASCVVGLRVYSKVAELKLEVVRPGDKSDGVTLDRDDIAKAAQMEAEKADEKDMAEQKQ